VVNKVQILEDYGVTKLLIKLDSHHAVINWSFILLNIYTRIYKAFQIV